MGMMEIIKELELAENILLVGHVSPDGDSIGSQLALAEGLEQAGKFVSIQAYDPTPAMMVSFDVAGRIVQTREIEGSFDLIILIECPVVSRCGFAFLPEARTAGIDHHPDYNLNADANWLDATSASTAELIFKLLLAMNLEITQNMANALYLGIVTDTGRFVYPNTKSETLEAAARLVRLGVKPDEIFSRIYRSYPVARLDLKRYLLSSMQRFHNERISLMTITKEAIADNEFIDDLFDDMVNMPLEAGEVKVSVLARETPQGIWRFNLRSKGQVDIGSVAGKFGGGGHRNAAGFRSELPLENTLNKLLPTLEQLNM